ncbi:MAG: HAMP domain-containing sensor histidine kinase [Spirochaetes bacterium]|nr:HAMP domain-containing sensor histidine kinase [Spirochaetota bacterium]
MTSIRAKLTVGASILFAGGLGILMAANALFLEPYYAAGTKVEFLRILAAMRASPGGAPSLSRTARELGAGTGCRITVSDGDGVVRVSSAPEFTDGQAFPLPKDQLEYFASNRERLGRGEPLFGILDADPRGQSVIQLVARLEPGRYLVVTQPLDRLRRDMAIASRFLLLVGALVLVLEFGIVLLLSGRMARPILELSEVARRVAGNDLAARYRHSRNDELGILGDSLNAMAAALARNIGELTAANRGLALEVKAQEDFIAGASHELKTPVGLMRGYAEAIQLGLYGTDAERDELADVILKEADHLDRLVRDLAQIAALGGTGSSLLPAEGDLFDTVSRAVSRFAHAAREKGVALGITGRGPIAARFDHDRILQVVDNLLSNGLRHAPEGGAIAVSVASMEGEALVEVENTGEPVPDAHLPHLFEPFYRVDASRSRGSGGSGLGLAVVRSVVEAHGGTCGIRNTRTGVAAWVRLPRGTQPPAGFIPAR